MLLSVAVLISCCFYVLAAGESEQIVWQRDEKKVAITFDAVSYTHLFRFILMKLGNSRFNRKPVLIVGYSQAAEAYIERVLTHKQWGYDILGILDDHLHTNESVRGISVLGPIESLEEYLSKNIAESIIITLKLKEYDRLEEIVHVCEKSGCLLYTSCVICYGE